jgi:uncharacterized membrane protein YfcA
MPPTLALLGLSLMTAAIGTLGGLGGAVFLVPLLVLFGVEPQVAAPLGILSVASGSLAAAPRQLGEGVVHHRLGVLLELPGAGAAIAGALIGNAVGGRALSILLALTAIGAAVASGRRKGIRNLPQPEFTGETLGEWPGTLGGAYRLGDGVVPYQARRLWQGMLAMCGAGAISGLAGVGGGFIMTPAMSEIMKVPVKVAAATTTFAVGITAATSLIVFGAQGRIDAQAGAAIVIGGLFGGAVGARIQEALPPARVRGFLSIALIIIGIMLLVRS